MTRIPVLVALALLPVPAQAAAMCFPWEVARGAVLDRFGEVPAFISTLKIADGDAVVTVTINPATGSWSLIVQPSADKACIVMSGEGWSVAPDAVAKPPDPIIKPQRLPGMRDWQYVIEAAG